MFPLYDDNPTEIFPIVTMALIAVCVGSWVYLQGAGLSPAALNSSVCALGMIPAEVTGQTGGFGGVRFGAGLSCAFGGLTGGTLLTSMFMHGSWMHLIGNMWFLWIFGNNVEDSMGHSRFLVFYLLTGLLGSMAHIASDPTSLLPTVGASGAISGIMGAYLLLYPRARVRTLLVIVILLYFVDLPAWLYLGYWFLLQVASSALEEGPGGVAFLAHIGGFVSGLLLIKLFQNRQLVDAKLAGIRLEKSQIRRGGWL